MKYMSLGVLVLVSAASVGAQQYPAPKSDDKVAKDSLTVTGCVGGWHRTEHVHSDEVQRCRGHACGPHDPAGGSRHNSSSRRGHL